MDNSKVIAAVYGPREVLCASNEDHLVVEPLPPPAGAKPGERVSFSGKQKTIISSNLFLFMVRDEISSTSFKLPPWVDYIIFVGGLPCSVRSKVAGS
ncbi:hypothetical protein YC2023_058107 [Brassica napus]